MKRAQRARCCRMNTAMGVVGLGDREPERDGILPHACISRHDRHKGRRVLEEFRRCHMHGVERANGLDREASSHAREDTRVYVKDEATSGERAKRDNSGVLVLGGQAAIDARTDDRARGLGEREGRGCETCPSGRGLEHGRVALQERRHQGTRFHVDHARGVGRGCPPRASHTAPR